jgi:pimeloyl-ACP methyl ester carboxylesterase
MSDTPTPIREGVVDLGSTGMYYRERGDGTPLVFVHAGIADGRMWQPQLEYFSDRYRVVVPDMRGFGRTPMAPSQFSYPEDLVSLCTALEIPEAGFVGASMGGTAVIDLALERPDLVACLVNIGGDPSGYEMVDPATNARWKSANEAFERGDLEGAAEIEFQMWVVGDEREASEVDPSTTELVLDMMLKSYDNPDGVELEPENPAVARLAEIEQPVLVIVGDSDRPDMLAAADQMGREVPHITVHWVKDSAHLPSLESPGLVNATIESFLLENRWV